MSAGRTRTSFVEAAVAHPLVAYTAVVLLQLRVVWRMWDRRDLPGGDTAGYFWMGKGWAHGLHDNIVWSPLYTNFLGTISAFVHGVVAAVFLHRLLIVFAATLLVLAVARALLPPVVALLVAIWWAAIPANFDFDYEVHLYGFLPILVAVLVLARSQSRVAKATAFGIFLTSTLLLRNELAIATALLATAIVLSEVRDRSTRVSARRVAAPYAIAIVVALLLTGGAYWRSYLHGHNVTATFRNKHELNFCQVYAFNYQQRHPTKFTASPWTQCGPLMQRTFGDQLPSMFTAIRSNPSAMGDFFGWNTRLFASGLEVSLFGATTTGDNPGYTLTHEHRAYATVLAALFVLLLVAAAVFASGRDVRRWLEARRWPLFALGTTILMTLIVGFTQRPRPEYLYPLTFGLVLAGGAALWVVARRFRAAPLLAVGAVLALVAGLIAYPRLFKQPFLPLRVAVSRLEPFRDTISRHRKALASPAYSTELCFYLARTYVQRCDPADWTALRQRASSEQSLLAALDRAHVTAIYATDQLWHDPLAARLLNDPERHGWREVAHGTDLDGRWSVLIRRA